jgi:hypothetical protein
MSVRKITNTGTRKNTGYVPSLKNERPIAYESLLERDCIYLFEFDDAISSFSEQPFKITYHIENRTYRYTPDFQVNYNNDKVVVFEVKPQITWDKIKENETKYAKYIAANKYCIANGLEFRILTDKEVYSRSLIKNIKFLFGYSRVNVPAYIKLSIRNLLIENGTMSISQILSCLKIQDKSENSTNYKYILVLLYSKYIKTDMEKPISISSLILL